MENLRRETVSQIEQVYSRVRQEMTDLNNQNLQRTTDKIDRLRDDMDYRAKENEKVKRRFFSLERRKFRSPLDQRRIN